MKQEEQFEKLKKLSEEINSYRKDIFKFDRSGNDLDFIPAHHNPREDGIYLTIRCGLTGIYTCINEWKDGRWQMEILDDSRTIAYSRNIVKLSSYENFK